MAPSEVRVKIYWVELLRLDLTTLIVMVLVVWAEARISMHIRARMTLFMAAQIYNYIYP